MIVWLNGAFGAGKTTTSHQFVAADPEFRYFDPEWVGYMLANNLADHAVADFQQYPSWRRLVPVVADEVVQFTNQHLVAAQSVLVEDYWREIATGMADVKLDIFHVVLHADAETLHARIDADHDEPKDSRPWRHRHVDIYQTALAWLRPAADLVVDTTVLGPLEVSQDIHTAVQHGKVPRRQAVQCTGPGRPSVGQRT